MNEELDKEFKALLRILNAGQLGSVIAQFSSSSQMREHILNTFTDDDKEELIENFKPYEKH